MPVSASRSSRLSAADGAYLPDGRRVAFDATGVDQVEFLISANPGEPLKPMARVASGGETARLMLALKSTLAHADATPTLIFDEIDQGIGGRVGAIVGQKLWHAHRPPAKRLDQQPDPHPTRSSASPICRNWPPSAISTIPSTSAWSPVNGEERTSTVVRSLEGEDRLDELTQMLGATGEAGAPLGRRDDARGRTGESRRQTKLE